MDPRRNKFGFFALVATQFLDAFNDNAFKLLASLSAVTLISQNHSGYSHLSLITTIFVLPFLLFSTYAGYLADRFNKRRIIIVVKIVEVLIMALGFFVLSAGDMLAMYIILFLMGIQSTFLGPAKYGLIPEILSDEQLSEGNGVMQMWTYIAIIIGASCGGYLFHIFHNKIQMAALVFMCISITGVVTSIFIPKTQAQMIDRKPEWNFIGELVRNIKVIRADRAIHFSVLGLVYFSFFGGMFQMNILVYAKELLHTNELYSGLILGVVALGLGIGSMLAGKLSEHKVEFGLVPVGCLGLSLFSVILGLTYSSLYKSLFALFVLGITSGFYIVPLNALVQQKSPVNKRGLVLSTLNFLSFSALLISSAVLYFLSTILKLNPAAIFIVMGILTLAVSIPVFRILPEAFIRLANWVMAHTFYKVKKVGVLNIPKEGGALLVCNHISYADPIIVLASMQRPVRFMVFRPIYNNPIINPFCRITKAIPIAFHDRPKTIIQSLEEAREAIKQGHLVCIFAEGGLTRTGNMLPFNKGFEFIMKGTDAPIIPLNIDRIWGSIFSYEKGKYIFKWPKIVPYPVTISVGKPMPATSKAYEVRAAVQELAADAFQYRDVDHKKIHVALVDEVKRHPFKFCMADSLGIELNYAKLLAGIITLSKKIFPAKDDRVSNEMIAVLLPSSCAAALVNGAIYFAGKVPVNLNFTASRESIEYAVKICSVNKIITSRRFLDKINFPVADNMVFIEDVASGVKKLEKMLALILVIVWPAFLLKRVFIRGDRKNIYDVATVIFSSGSTGQPKGVMLSHANITSNIQGLYQILNIQPNDVVLGVLPFFHSLGFTGTLCLPVGSGMGVVYHANPLDAATIGKLAEQYKATIIIGTPTFISAYTRKCTKEQFKYLRFAVAGAEKLKKSIADAFYEKFNVIPLEGYGATELSPIVSIGIPDYISEEEHIKQTGYKEGTVGHPLPGVAVKVVDPDTYKQLPPNTEGLLLVKGSNVMLGYLKDDAKTKEVIKDGWYVTGDIAKVDDDGFICITDRLSRFSKIGGEMVPHIKIEELIQGIIGANEPACVVTSVADEKKGERLAVLYKGDLNLDDIWNRLNEAEIPKLWIPKREAFYKIEEIPILGSGKIDLKQVKELANKLSESEKEQ